MLTLGGRCPRMDQSAELISAGFGSREAQRNAWPVPVALKAKGKGIRQQTFMLYLADGHHFCLAGPTGEGGRGVWGWRGPGGREQQ
jgi:hypothetical protein